MDSTGYLYRTELWKDLVEPSRLHPNIDKELKSKILGDSGNAIIVAMDHGLLGGVYEGFENPEVTLDKVLEGNPDGILAGPNFLRCFRKKLMAKQDLSKIVTLDLMNISTIPTTLGEGDGQEIQHQLFNVEEAVKIGIDAIKSLLVFGREDPTVYANNIKYVAGIADKARELEVPFIVEPTLWGKKIEDETDPGLIEHANRVAFELGANIIKCPYTGTEETFAPIVQNNPLPILILGGPRIETTADVLEMVRGAMKAGARGVFFGRNIWQHPEPAMMIKALRMIVHEDKPVESALELFKKRDRGWKI